MAAQFKDYYQNQSTPVAVTAGDLVIFITTSLGTLQPVTIADMFGNGATPAANWKEDGVGYLANDNTTSHLFYCFATKDGTTCPLAGGDNTDSASNVLHIVSGLLQDANTVLDSTHWSHDGTSETAVRGIASLTPPAGSYVMTAYINVYDAGEVTDSAGVFVKRTVGAEPIVTFDTVVLSGSIAQTVTGVFSKNYTMLSAVFKSEGGAPPVVDPPPPSTKSWLPVIAGTWFNPTDTVGNAKTAQLISALVFPATAANFVSTAQATTAWTATLTTQVSLVGSGTATTHCSNPALVAPINLAGSGSSFTTNTTSLTTRVVLTSSVAANPVTASSLITKIKLQDTENCITLASGSLTTQVQLSGQGLASTSNVGVLTAGPSNSMTGTGVATTNSVPNTLTTTVKLLALSQANPTATVGVTTQVKLGGLATAFTTAAAALLTTIQLATTRAATTSATTALSTQVKMTGTGTSSTVTAANINSSIQLLGFSSAVGSPVGGGYLSTQVRVSSTASASTIGLASILTSVKLATANSAQVSGNGSLSTSIQLSGTGVVVPSYYVELSVAGGAAQLKTTSVASTTAVAVLNVPKLLMVVATASTNSTGLLTTKVRLASIVTCAGTSQGSLSTQIQLQGTASGQTGSAAAVSTQTLFCGHGYSNTQGTGTCSTQIWLSGVGTAEPSSKSLMWVATLPSGESLKLPDYVQEDLDLMLTGPVSLKLVATTARLECLNRFMQLTLDVTKPTLNL